MGRFILRYHGQGAKPPRDVERFRALPGARLLDDSTRMLLIEAPEAALRELIDQVQDWSLTPERTYHLPKSHPNLAQPKPRPPR
jgi:hypothetical protein